MVIITSSSFHPFQQLLVEIEQRNRSVKGLNRMAEKLMEDYSQDDTTKIKQSIDQVNSKFTNLLTRYVKNRSPKVL
jgi:NAD-dependent SIR2 family protein deacetylase